MRVLIPSYFIFPQRVGGAEQMVYNLLRGFSANQLDAKIILGARQTLDPNFQQELPSLRSLSLTRTNYVRNRFVSEQMFALFNQLEADIALFPNYFTPPVRNCRVKKFVTIVHDLQYKTYPSHFSATKRRWLDFALESTSKKADRIIAISHHTAAEIETHLGSEARAKTTVIPNPIYWMPFPKTPSPENRPYIFSLSSHYPHKNYETLIRAFHRLRDNFPQLLLIIMGTTSENLLGGMARSHLSQLVRHYQLEDRVRILGHRPVAEVLKYMMNTELFVFPSLYEGFGMPPVEALGYGISTLTTRCGALEETTLGLANYVEDPLDDFEWADRIQQLLSSPARPEEAERTARCIRETYDLNKCGKNYIMAMQKLL